MVKKSSKAIKRLQIRLGDSAQALKVLQTQDSEVMELSAQLPIIDVLCNPALRPRHWSDIQSIIGSEASSTELTLSLLKQLDIPSCLDQLAEISEKANKEARLEAMLSKMEQEWQSQVLELVSFGEAGILVL